MSTAVVVGSGPNGLACAAELARRGVEVTVLEAAETIGGGTRTTELTEPGLLHDHCSAVHPMATGSPLFLSLDLERYGLEWCWPEVDLAHPFDDGTAAALLRSVEATAAGLGADGARWKRLFGPLGDDFPVLGEDLMRPVINIPRHPIKLGLFGLRAGLPATVLARAFRGGPARALFGGVAAHALARLDLPMSASVGVALTAACHAYGWPVAKGGSAAITDALAASLTDHGGRIETGVLVESESDIPAADAVIFDLAPVAVARIAGGRLPDRVRKAYLSYSHGPGAFKVDMAIEGGVPWTAEAPRRAGTVHVIGSFDEIVAAEREITRGLMPERPFVLVGQQHLADPTRSNGDLHPLWAYAHVPNSYAGDATEALLGQIERFAPGFRERIVSTVVRSTTELAAYNRNYVGGDILTGSNTPLQTVIRPRPALDPYSCGADGHYICSAATPPGAGVHGMCGYNAAQSVLGDLGL